MNNEILIDILRASLTQTPLLLSEEIDFNKLYSISARHDVSSMVSIALRDAGYNITEKFKKSEILAAYTTEQQAYELAAFSKVLKENNIPFILLKGAVINKYYPQKYMRTSRDIDVLVHEKNIKKIFNILSKELSYKPRIDPNDHHRSMNTPSGMHIEFHYSLSNDTYLPVETAFKNSVLINENLVLGDKYFFVYHIIHMAGHFKFGGCGIRSITDLWIMRHIMKLDFDFEILKSIGLDKFAKAVTELSNVWFGDEKGVTTSHTKLTKHMEHFILSGGSFGNTENQVTISRGNKNLFSHILSRFFLPFSEMRKKYPILNKLSILLPIFWLVRLMTSVFNGRTKSITKEIVLNNNISDNDLEIGKYLSKELKL